MPFVDKSKLFLPGKGVQRGVDASFFDEMKKGLGRDIKKLYAGVEDTVLERSSVLEFEFEGFSVVVEDGVWGVQYEDEEEGLVVQNLVGEGDFEPKFPYLFMVNGVEYTFSEEDYKRLRKFMEGES